MFKKPTIKKPTKSDSQETKIPKIKFESEEFKLRYRRNKFLINKFGEEVANDVYHSKTPKKNSLTYYYSSSVIKNIFSNSYVQSISSSALDFGTNIHDLIEHRINGTLPKDCVHEKTAVKGRGDLLPCQIFTRADAEKALSTMAAFEIYREQSKLAQFETFQEKAFYVDRFTQECRFEHLEPLRKFLHENEIKIKIKADCLRLNHDGTVTILDWKTTTAKNFGEIYRASEAYGYEFSLGLYTVALEQLGIQVDCAQAVFLIKTKDPCPPVVKIYPFKNEFGHKGHYFDGALIDEVWKHALEVHNKVKNLDMITATQLGEDE